MGLFGDFLLLGIGIYSGLYIGQNYRVPRVDGFEELFNKVRIFAAKFEKPAPIVVSANN